MLTAFWITPRFRYSRHLAGNLLITYGILRFPGRASDVGVAITLSQSQQR